MTSASDNSAPQPAASAEAALRLSEATKTAILDAALDCIVTIDHRGMVVDWNPAAERTFGYSPLEAVGREMSELIIPGPLREMHRRGLARAVSTGHDAMAGKRIEITAQRKDGRTIPVELAITRIAAQPVPLFTGHIRDISARKHVEDLQAAQYAVARALAESVQLAEAAPRILQAVCESLRWDFGALWRVERQAKRLQCVESWQRPGAAVQAFADATRAATFARGVGLPGRVWKSAAPDWIADVLADANFPRARDAAQCGLHAAFAFPISLGNEVLGAMEFFSHEIRAPDPQLLATLAAIGSQTGQFIERKRAEAELRDLNKTLEHRVAGRTVELTRAKQELVKALEQEKELSRLKTSFVNLVSHEFRTPLGVIVSAADILETYFERLKPEQRTGHLQDIRHATQQMTGLMEEVLLLGKVEAGRMEFRPEPVDLPGFCRRLVDEQLSATSRKCPILLKLESLDGAARGDEALLRHMFTNLLSNAVKYSPAGSQVHFTARREGREAVFEVRDHGIGIPAEDQRHLFEAFHRARNVGEIPGTGLGLVIVKRCVDLHAGLITVQSEVRSGTTFVVRLSMFPPAAPKAPVRKTRKGAKQS